MYILIYILVMYSNGVPTTSTTMNVEFNTKETCLIAVKDLSKKLDVGDLTIGCFKK